jgi:hypothetical protein
VNVILSEGRQTMQRLIIRGLIGVGVVVGAAIVSMVSGLIPIGGGGGGGGDGSESTTPPAAVVEPAEPEPPPPEPVVEPAASLEKQLVVTIDDRRYLVDGQEKTIDEIAQLADRVPDEFSVRVIILRKDTSRADAENALADKLDSQGISHEMKDK